MKINTKKIAKNVVSYTILHCMMYFICPDHIFGMYSGHQYINQNNGMVYVFNGNQLFAEIPTTNDGTQNPNKLASDPEQSSDFSFRDDNSIARSSYFPSFFYLENYSTIPSYLDEEIEEKQQSSRLEQSNRSLAQFDEKSLDNKVPTEKSKKAQNRNMFSCNNGLSNASDNEVDYEEMQLNNNPNNGENGDLEPLVVENSSNIQKNKEEYLNPKNKCCCIIL
ncbi:MAG: hypothetical protein LBT90_00245 [Holosporaceae bacterium]|jgi:DNA segregation ATPase FtsK/SpoIIIE-like protein|nr:hypothetical protein [Holosporaceae bacterium]